MSEFVKANHPWHHDLLLYGYAHPDRSVGVPKGERR